MFDVASGIRLVEVILAGGVGYIIKSAWDWFVRRSEAQTPHASATFQLSHTGQQVDLLARVNAELEGDIDRLRLTLTAVEAHARESELAWQARENAWLAEKRQMQEQLDQMHAQVRAQLDQIETLQRRWADLERR